MCLDYIAFDICLEIATVFIWMVNYTMLVIKSLKGLVLFNYAPPDFTLIMIPKSTKSKRHLLKHQQNIYGISLKEEETAT